MIKTREHFIKPLNIFIHPLIIILILVAFKPSAHAGTFTAFGPKTFIRETGSPITETASFNVKNPNTTHTLKVYNGGLNSEYAKVSSAIVKLNGSSIFSENDFNQQVPYLQKQVSVNKNNDLSVELRSAPGSGLTVFIEGEDSDPPSATITSPANGLYTNMPSASVVGSASDATSWISSVTVNGTTAFLTGEIYTSNIQLTEGQNTITARATDAGGSTESAIVSVILDTILPRITIDHAPSMTNKPQLTISGKIEDASPITSLTVNGIPAILANNTFTAAINLIEGTNNIAISATDMAGNVDSTSAIVILDTIPPVFSITSPANGTTVNINTVTASGTIDDNAATVTVNGINATVGNKLFTASNINLLEGTNTITVTAKDPAGNQTSTSLTITRSTGPVITVQYPAEGAVFDNPWLDVYGTVSEGTTSVTITGSMFGRAFLNGNSFTSSYGFGLPGPGSLPSVYLPNIGENKITITAMNASGQTSTKTITVYYYDTKAPEISGIHLTKSGSSYYVQQGGFTSYAAVDIDVTVYDFSTPITITVNGKTVVGGEYQYGFYDINLPLTEGLNNITITATDAAGNKATETTSVTLDTKSPVITITSPINNAYLNTSSITVTGNIEEDNIDNITLQISSGGYKIPATIENNTFTASGIVLTEGINSVAIKAVDKAGHISYASIMVYIDTIAPTITITSPANGSTVNTSTITLTGSINDSTATVIVSGIAAMVANNKFTASNIPLAEGANTITAIATDAVGNSTTSLVTITYVPDTSPPVISMTSPISGSAVSTNIVTINGSIDDNTATVTVNGLNATVANNKFTLYNFPLTEGANNVTITATDPAGNKTTYTFTITYDVTLPTVTSTTPAFNATDLSLDTAVTVTFSENMNVASITTSNFTLDSTYGPVSGSITYIGNTATFTPSSSLIRETIYTATIKGGNNGVKDIAGNLLAGDYTWLFKTKALPLQISITDPKNWSTVNKSIAIIKGTVKSQISDFGITVKGMPAEVNGGIWAAQVPLQAGQNAVVATATDSNGNTDNQSFSIYTNYIQQPVKITTNPQNGIAPMNTTFSIDTTISNPITNYKIDFEGDGVTDLETTNPSNITHTYDTPGIYYPSVTVTDNQGNTYAETTVINVLDKTQMDALLKGKWEGVKVALGSGDANGAIKFFANSVASRYEEIFTAMQGKVSMIASDMGEIGMIYLKNGSAKYRIRKTGTEGEMTYYIYFVLDEDGFWKIYKF